MKHFPICRRLKFFPVILLLCFSAFGQQPADTVVNRDLALEVNRGVDRPWVLRAFTGGGGEASNFKRIDSWKPSNGEAPVAGILFKLGREGDIVIAHLSVRLENDKQVPVETYRLTESDTIKTEALTKFGLEPLVLRVVKAKPDYKDTQSPIMPKVENKTTAIEVVSLTETVPPSDSFQLSLRNISNKKVVVLDLFMPSVDGNGGGGTRSHSADKDRPLMIPGAISQHPVGISRGGRMTPEGFVPDAMVQQTLIIRTVVFDDGTFDGLAEPAAEIEARSRGLRIQLSRILRLLHDSKASDEGSMLTTLNELKEQAYALGKTVDPSVVLELKALFPSLNEKAKSELEGRIESGLRDGKLEFLRYISDFEDRQKAPDKAISFAKWLEQTKASYEKLINRIY